MAIQIAPAGHGHAGVVFVEPRHAMVARSGEPKAVVRTLERRRETEPEFLRRVVHETADCDRLVVMGPGVERLAFEREYVALHRRPDRIVRDESATCATPFDLLDRLRIIDAA